MDRFCVLLRFNFWISFCIELLPLDKPFAGSHVYRCRSCIGTDPVSPTLKFLGDRSEASLVGDRLSVPCRECI